MFFYIILCKVLLPKETNKVFKCMWSSSPLNRLMNLTKLALRGKWVHYKLLKRPIPVLQLSIINYVDNVNVKWFSDLHYSYEVYGGLFCTQLRSFYVQQQLKQETTQIFGCCDFWKQIFQLTHIKMNFKRSTLFFCLLTS